MSSSSPHHEVTAAPPGSAEIASALLDFLRSILAIIGGTFALGLLVTVVFEPTDAVMVFGPQDRTFAAIVASDGLVVEQGDGFTVGRATGPGFVRNLYASGAWAVLPSFGGGCITTPLGLRRNVGPRLP